MYHFIQVIEKDFKVTKFLFFLFRPIGFISLCLFLLEISPAYASFKDHFSLTKSKQYLLKERIGTQLQLYNKTTRYGFCAISINDGHGAAILFVAPKKTVSFDIGYQDYDDDHSNYEYVYSLRCIMMQGRHTIKYDDIKHLEKIMQLAVSERDGFLPDPHDSRERLSSLDFLYVNRERRIKNDGQAIGLDLLIRETHIEEYFVCKLTSTNLHHKMMLFFPPASTTRFHLLRAQNGKLDFRIKCAGYPIGSTMVKDLLTE